MKDYDQDGNHFLHVHCKTLSALANICKQTCQILFWALTIQYLIVTFETLEAWRHNPKRIYQIYLFKVFKCH